jgi:hypothetical protein
MSNSRQARPGTRSDKWKLSHYDAVGQQESPDLHATRAFALAFLLGACCLATFRPVYAQLVLGVSVNKAPPPLPVYDQPMIPAPGYLWVPGYWAWSEGVDYYWVPGTWILPPKTGLLWTPGYWESEEGVYVFHVGYWGPHIGFYGGVDYGFGYNGTGYEGGYWKDGRFFYNSSVNNIANVSVTNVYSNPVAIDRTSNASFNGGMRGTTAKATAEQLAAEWEHHIAATPEQTRHAEAALKDPALSLSRNHGRPAIAATPHAGLFKGPGVVAARLDKPIEAPASKAPVVSNATLIQGNVANHKLPSPKGTAATSIGPNENKSLPGAKLLERQSVKPDAPVPHHAPLPPPPTASITPQTAKPVAQALRPAPQPTATRPPPPTKTKCPPGQQHC